MESGEECRSGTELDQSRNTEQGQFRIYIDVDVEGERRKRIHDDVDFRCGVVMKNQIDVLLNCGGSTTCQNDVDLDGMFAVEFHQCADFFLDGLDEGARIDQNSNHAATSSGHDAAFTMDRIRVD